jgi:tryptophan synthase beta chain
LLVNLSGRGDKDMHTAAEYFGLLDGEATPSGTADEPRAEGDGRTQL